MSGEPEGMSDAERQRWLAGRDDWREGDWQDHCGAFDCQFCTGETPMGRPRAPQPLQQGGEVTQAALIKALEPFALLAGYGDPENATVNLSDPIGKWLTFAQLHDAASVMNALTSPAHRQKDQPHD